MSSLGEWFRPSRTVPVTPWAAGETNWKPSPKTLLVLLLGLWLFGTGEAALVAAHCGVSPWVVFSQGISLKTGLSIGWSTLVISIAVLLLWIPLRRRPGLGTILNIIVIALALQVMIPFFPTPNQLGFQIVEAIFGVALVGLGSSLYITCNVGPGPRDGLMTGLHAKTGIRIGRVRLGIEAIVLVIGWLLGGTVGIGTLIFALFIGQSVALWFGVVSRFAEQPQTN